MTDLAAPTADEVSYSPRPSKGPSRYGKRLDQARRALALAAFGGLLTGCAPQPQYYPPESPETQANQACVYVSQGPGTPAYRSCYDRALRQLRTAR